MMRRALLAWMLGFSLLHTAPSSAKTFDIADIVETSISIDCLDYCVIGICVHLICTPWGCTIEYSARVSHYIPDLVVTVYDEVEEQPWEEFKPFQELLTSSIDNIGAGLMQMDELNSQSIRVKNASAVGHPFLVLFGSESEPEAEEGSGSSGGATGSEVFGDDIEMELSDESNNSISSVENDTSFEGFCASDVTPFMPYYDSSIDLFEWRFGVIDRLVSIWEGYHIFGSREIGSMDSINPIGENTWGAVYPRIGFILQQEDPKAAAVIAQRAVDVVTRSDMWRIKMPLPGEESNEKTDQWQMISPQSDSVCQSFGSTDADWSEGRNPDGKAQYGWSYWRKYTCCMESWPLIAVIPITPICINEVLGE